MIESNKVLILSVTFSCLLSSTMLRTKTYHFQTVPYKLAQNRRYRPLVTPPPPPRGPNERNKLDGYYKPYWEEGHLVFHRSPTKTPNVDHNECNQACLDIYETYGAVCGMRLRHDKWTYDYKTFSNMCFLELENCKNKTKTWYPAYQGNCTEGLTTHSSDSTDIVARKIEWLKPFY